MAVTAWTAANNKWKQNLSSTSSATATSLGVGTGGFMGMDIAFSIQLSSTRFLWIFGDSWWPTASGQIRVNGVLIRNAVALQVGSDFSSSTLTCYASPRFGSTTDPWPYFRANSYDGHPLTKYPMCGTLLDDGFGRNYVLVLGMNHIGNSTQSNSGGRAGSDPVGSWAMMLGGDITGSDPSTWEQVEVPLALPRPRSGRRERNNYLLQNGIANPGDGYIYVWTQGPWDNSGEWAVCRWPLTDVLKVNMLSPQWWAGDDRWVYDHMSAKGMVRYRRNVAPSSIVAEQPGAVHLRGDGQYQLTCVPELFNDTTTRLQGQAHVQYSLVSTPGEVFPALTNVYNIPNQVLDDNEFVYGAYSCPGQTWSGQGAGDQLMVYSRNNAGADLLTFTDARQYWPEMIQVTGI